MFTRTLWVHCCIILILLAMDRVEQVLDEIDTLIEEIESINIPPSILDDDE